MEEIHKYDWDQIDISDVDLVKMKIALSNEDYERLVKY